MKNIRLFALVSLLVLLMAGCTPKVSSPVNDETDNTPPPITDNNDNASDQNTPSENDANAESNGNNSDTGDMNNTDNDSNDNTPNDSDQSESQSSDHSTPASDISYDVNVADINDYDNITGSYLMVDEGVGKLPQQYINDILKSSIDNLIVGDAKNMNPMTIHPVVMTKNNSVLSVLYEGTIQAENSEYQIWSPVNIDIQTTDQITVSNLVKSDLKDQEAFNTIFSQKALESGYEFDSPQEWMGMYIEDDAIVYFFNENDLSDSYVLITVPIDSIQDYLNYKL